MMLKIKHITTNTIPILARMVKITNTGVIIVAMTLVGVPSAGTPPE